MSDKAITMKRQGSGFYSVHIHGDRMTRLSVWDRRRLKERGWLLITERSALYGGNLEEVFSTLELLRQWVERRYTADPVGAEHDVERAETMPIVRDYLGHLRAYHRVKTLKAKERAKSRAGALWDVMTADAKRQALALSARGGDS